MALGAETQYLLFPVSFYKSCSTYVNHECTLTHLYLRSPWASLLYGCFDAFVLPHLHNTDLKGWLFADWPERPSTCLIIHLDDLFLMGLAHPMIRFASRNGGPHPLSNQWTGCESVSLTGDIWRMCSNHLSHHRSTWGICNSQVQCSTQVCIFSQQLQPFFFFFFSLLGFPKSVRDTSFLSQMLRLCISHTHILCDLRQQISRYKLQLRSL